MASDALNDAEYLAGVRALEQGPSEESHRAPKFVLLSIADVEKIPPPTFLVDNIIIEGSASCMYGPPGTGKTFAAIDVALSVAAGASFFGHPVKQGRVVYVLAEGQSGMGSRIRAWKAARQMFGDIQFSVVPMPVQLLQPGDVELFVKAIADGLPESPVLIVLDTFARCFLGGEENSARDMGLAVATVDALRRRTGAAILLVHHTRKGGDEERGSVALRGGMDTMLFLKGEDGRVTLHCDKQKDAAEFPDIQINLVQSADSMVFSLPGQQHAGPSRMAMLVLERLIDDFPGDRPTKTEWKEAADTPKTSFWRAVGELVRAGYVAEEKDGRTKRYAATPDGKAAAALMHRATENADRFHRFQIGSNGSTSPAEVASAGGGGAFRPPPTATTEPLGTILAKQVPNGSDRFHHNSGTYSLSEEAELFAQIEETRAIQFEANADVYEDDEPLGGDS